MKKIKRILIVLILLLIIIFAINFIRNYVILKSIFNANNKLKENLNNYYLEAEDNSSSMKTCIYSKDNIYSVDIYSNNILVANIWIDAISQEYIVKDVQKNEFEYANYDDFYTKYYQFLCLDFHDFDIKKLILESYLFKGISEENNEYKISLYEGDVTVFINKESKLITKTISEIGAPNEIHYKFNTEKIDKELTKPEVSL